MSALDDLIDEHAIITKRYCHCGWQGDRYEVHLVDVLVRAVGDSFFGIVSGPDAALDVLADLVDPDPCWFDHHGYCQAHSWLQEGQCPHARAKELLT